MRLLPGPAAFFRRIAFVGALALAGTVQPAHATAYNFPGNLPPGCSGSAGTYTCSAGALGYNDTISFGAPATVTVNGDLGAQNVQLNAGGNAADVTLKVSGALSVLYGARFVANVSAGSVIDPDGSVVFGGTLATQTGTLRLGTGSSVAGNLSTTSGAITLNQGNRIGGSVTSTSGAISIGYQSVISGSVSSSGPITVAQEATVAGAVTGTTGAIDIGYAAKVSSTVTSSSGTINFAQNSVASACVKSTGSARITLGYQASVNSVCCGSSTCGNSCIAIPNANNPPMPPLCTAPAALLASYNFEESGWTGSAGELKDSAGASGGPYNGAAQGSPLPASASVAPALTGSPGTCGYASLPGPQNGGGNFAVNGLPVSTVAGAQTSLAFWMYWTGSDRDIVISWPTYDLWLYSGAFGFNTTNSDVYGMASSGLANGWHHVVAVFTNGSLTANKLYVDGSARTLSQRVGSAALGQAKVGTTLSIGSYGAGSGFNFSGRIDDLRVYTGAVTPAEVAALYAQTHTCPVQGPHHLEIRHDSGSGLTCTPSTLTVAACANAACTTLYTGAVNGTLTAGGSGMTVNWPTGATFSIAAGSGTTTEDFQVTTPGSVLIGISGISPVPASGTTCNFGNPACTFTAADSGFEFAVGDHVADVQQTSISVMALRKADRSAVCVPAFASVTKSVTFSCGYLNPGSGYVPVRVGGTALNAANSAAAACDAGGRAVSLAFNASGVASTTVQYADVGRVRLDASYAGSGGSEPGLSMKGSDSFVTAPYDFAISALTAGNIVAGTSFGATVTARNYSGTTTPNFGRESSPESVTLAFVRTQPSGSGASNGNFSGSIGSFANGAASATALRWSEVGRGDLAVLLASGNYLASGQNAAGSSGGRSATCAGEGGTCTLPSGATALVAYGANGQQATLSGVTGSIGCNNGTFGDPFFGTVKSCSYFVTGGAWPGEAGSAGRFVPHHFDEVVTPACGTFSYAAQPFSVKLSAMNGLAPPGLTVNYDGSAATAPNFARAVTLSDVPVLGLGSFGSTAAVAASLFSAGVATTLAPAYTFTNKLTATQNLVVRAVDTDGISSAGFSEGSTALRSGRLEISNAFGSEKLPLPMAVQAQYWSGKAWVANGADACTSVPAGAVALSGYLDGKGAATAAWSTSASAFTLSAGNATLTLAAPGGATTGSVDVAVNLGPNTATADQTCLSAHPASLGAGLPWLRAQRGSCAVSWDRDPAARASFGIYAPETRKTFYVREIF